MWSEHFNMFVPYPPLPCHSVLSVVEKTWALELSVSCTTRPSHRYHPVVQQSLGSAERTRPAARPSPWSKRPIEDPESLKALAEPINELLRELLEESPEAIA